MKDEYVDEEELEKLLSHYLPFSYGINPEIVGSFKLQYRHLKSGSVDPRINFSGNVSAYFVDGIVRELEFLRSEPYFKSVIVYDVETDE